VCVCECPRGGDSTAGGGDGRRTITSIRNMYCGW
jgi:hypothetical protein